MRKNVLAIDFESETMEIFGIFQTIYTTSSNGFVVYDLKSVDFKMRMKINEKRLKSRQTKVTNKALRA